MVGEGRGGGSGNIKNITILIKYGIMSKHIGSYTDIHET